MKKKWGLSLDTLKNLKKKYKKCVYCGIKLKEYPHRRGNPIGKANIEHLDNDDNNRLVDNIVRCCSSCGSSKLDKTGKDFLDWFDSPYCKDKKISKKSVHPIVKKYINSIK